MDLHLSFVRLLSRALPALLLLSAGRTVFAQEPLTLDAAVRQAITRNASIRAAQAGTDEASARIDQAKSGFFPRISVAESWQRGNQPVFVFSSLLSARQFSSANFAIDALNHPDPIGFFRTTIGVDQIVFDGGRQRAATSASTAGRDIAAASHDEAAAGIVLATTQTFGRVIAAEAARRAADAGLAAAREDLARAGRRRDAGMATDADVLSIAVHVANLEQRGIQADGDAAVARAELNRLMGTDVHAPVRVAEPAPPGFDAATANVDALLAEADTSRPEIRRAAAAARAADANRHQARSALIPQIGAQAAVDVSGTSIADRASSWIVGGELRWTFSTGGNELAGLKAADAAIARARAEADDVRAAVHVDVVGALARLNEARAREAAGRAAVEEARESQRIIRNRFEQGVTPVTDVLRVSSAVLDAEANRTSALVDTMIAGAQLRRAVGRMP